MSSEQLKCNRCDTNLRAEYWKYDRYHAKSLESCNKCLVVKKGPIEERYRYCPTCRRQLCKTCAEFNSLEAKIMKSSTPKGKPSPPPPPRSSAPRPPPQSSMMDTTGNEEYARSLHEQQRSNRAFAQALAVQTQGDGHGGSGGSTTSTSTPQLKSDDSQWPAYGMYKKTACSHK